MDCGLSPIYGTSASAGFHPLGSCEPLGVVVDHGAFREGPDAGVAGRSLDARGRRESRVSASSWRATARIQRPRTFPSRNALLRLRYRRRGARQGPGTCFQAADGQPIYQTWLNRQHGALRTLLKLAVEFVPHSFRHTYGTRLGESGADAFTIMRLMGHSTVTVSQKYVHPSPETMERAVQRLQSLKPGARDGGLRRTPFKSPYKSVRPRAEKCSKSLVFKYARVAK